MSQTQLQGRIQGGVLSVKLEKLFQFATVF